MSFNLTNLQDGSFAGVAFMESFNGGYTPDADLRSKDAILEIPGSSNVYHQDFGQAARTFSKDVIMSTSNYTLMQSKHMVSGSLVSYTGTVTARLRNIVNVRFAGHSLGIVLATLEFLRA